MEGRTRVQVRRKRSGVAQRQPGPGTAINREFENIRTQVVPGHIEVMVLGIDLRQIDACQYDAGLTEERSGDP